jgi:hypothetical protein
LALFVPAAEAALGWKFLAAFNCTAAPKHAIETDMLGESC